MAKKKEDVSEAAAAKAKPNRAKLAARWGGHESLLDDGFVPVVRPFLKYAAQMRPGLQPAESLFVINLLYHKWDSRRPYPSYKTIAARMGVSVQYARDLARRLERKGLLVREARVGRPNRFELQPLFDALARYAQAEAAKKSQPAAA